MQQRLAQHPFYGNVRELRNVIDRAIALGGDPLEALGSLNSALSAPPSASMATQEGAPLSGESPAAVSLPPPARPALSPVVSASPLSAHGGPHPSPLVDPPAPAFTVPPDTPTSEVLPAPADGAFRVDVEWELPFKEAKEQLLDAFEASYLSRLIERSPGMSASALAKEAKIDRKHLYTLAKKHAVDLAANKSSSNAD